MHNNMKENFKTLCIEGSYFDTPIKVEILNVGIFKN